MPLCVVKNKSKLKWYQHRRSPSSKTDGSSAGQEATGDQLREKFCLDPVVRLCGAFGSAPASTAGDLGSNPNPGENFSLKLT